MKALWRVLVSAALIALGVGGVTLRAAAGTTPPVQSSVSQSDFNAYCLRHYPGGGGVELVQNTAYGWECVTASGQRVGIWVASVCQEVNPDTPNVVAWMHEEDYLNPYNAWQCEELLHQTTVSGQPFGYQGGLNLTPYCQAQGYDKVALTGDNVSTWQCESSTLTPLTVDMYNACNWAYNSGGTSDVAIPTFNYWNPNSVTCWR